MSFKCMNCGKCYANASNLSKHMKNKICIKNEPINNQLVAVQQSSTEMMIQLLRENELLKSQIEKMNSEAILKDQLINETRPEIIELPYTYDELSKCIYKYNPFTRQYSIKKHTYGYVSKNYKSWYVLNYFDKNDYPDNTSMFYKKCLEVIIQNIPDNKLPYRVKDANRHVYDIYNYTEFRWIRGKTEDLVELIVKPFLSLIQASIYSAINETKDLTIHDFNILENSNIDTKKWNSLKSELQIDIINKFSLPSDDSENDDTEDIKESHFYKKHFGKILIDRFKNGTTIEIDENEFKEHRELRSPITPANDFCSTFPKSGKKQKQKITLIKMNIEDDTDEIYIENYEVVKYDSDEDDGYKTDTDLKRNPYFDFNYELEE